MIRFKSKIFKVGINPVVDPPEHALNAIFDRAGRSKGPVPVRGTLNKEEFVQTLVKYKGAWRLYINGPMLKKSGLKVGDIATVEMDYDTRPRAVPVPDELEAGLRIDVQAKACFDALAPSRQKEILRYIGSLKSPAAIEKNVTRILAHLRGENVDHVLTRSRRKS
jgi:hypothetical protein